MAAVNPYVTAIRLNRPAPTHVRPGAYDADRIRSYYTYEDIWNNIELAFDALLRTSDDPLSRRYIPTVRTIIEATNRYLAHDMEISWDPTPGTTVPDEAMNDYMARLGQLWAREEVPIKLLSMKRWWLVKGDSLLTITADPSKEQGTRLSINEVEPEQYFPIHDPADLSRVTGVYLASIVRNDEDEDIIQRIEYQKIQTPEQAAAFPGSKVGGIFYRVGFYELNGWDDRPGDDPQELAAVDPPAWAEGDAWAVLLAGTTLPAQITRIPVYHFRNNRRGGAAGIFGTSEIQGLETIFAGVTQNATDEDLSVALAGIGAYWTDSGHPRDANGKEVDWEIGPAAIIELEKDGKFGRVEGVGSVQPLQDHIKFMQSSAREASGVPDIAVGQVGAQAAASGVALQIEFMPILAKNAEKEQEVASKLTQLLFDLNTMWFPAYEAYTPPEIAPSISFGNPIPVDRAATITEITQLVAAKIVSIEWAQGELSEKLGFQFPADMLAAIAAEQESMLDATGARIDAAAETPIPGEEG